MDDQIFYEQISYIEFFMFKDNLFTFNHFDISASSLLRDIWRDDKSLPRLKRLVSYANKIGKDWEHTSAKSLI